MKQWLQFEIPAVEQCVHHTVTTRPRDASQVTVATFLRWTVAAPAAARLAEALHMRTLAALRGLAVEEWNN
jgi:hypothetical protein